MTSVSFTPMPPTDPTQTAHPDLQLQVEQQAPPDAMGVSVKKGNWVDASQSPTHFPDSDTPAGNTMVCLENALIERYAQYAQDKGIPFSLDNAGDREHALHIMKQSVSTIHSHLLKQGERADSPVVAETYTKKETVWRHETQAQLQARIQEKKARGEQITSAEKWGLTQERPQEVDKTYYKFHVTWELELILPDGTTDTLSKTQWLKTGVALPKPAIHPSAVFQSQHVALLAVKTHRHIHKAAFNPRHPQYEQVKKKIEHLKSHNLISKENLDRGNMKFAGQKSFGLEDGPVHYSIIRLGDQKLTFLHHKEGRKLNNTYTKWEKTTPPSMKNPQEGVTTQGHKIYTQAASMIIRDPHILSLDKEDDLEPEKLVERYQENNVTNRTAPALKKETEDPSLDILNRIKRDQELLKSLKDKFDTEDNDLRMGLLEMAVKGMEEQQGFTGQLAAFGIQAAAVFAEDKITEQLTSQFANEFNKEFDARKARVASLAAFKYHQTYQSTNHIREQINKLRDAVKEIDQLERRIAALEKLHEKSAIENHRSLGDDTKEMLLAHLAAREEALPKTSHSVESREKKLKVYQSIIDLDEAFTIIELAANPRDAKP